MGYTHYWRRPAEIPQEVWDQWAEDVRTIIKNLPEHSQSAGGYHANDPLALAWEHDQPQRPPQIDGSLVRFNGTTPKKDHSQVDARWLDSDDLGHETFYVERVLQPDHWQRPDERGRYFTFCKTARKPYDLAVCACLIRMGARMAEGVDISSDGWSEEWEEARQFCEDLFGFAAVPFKDEVEVLP